MFGVYRFDRPTYEINNIFLYHAIQTTFTICDLENGMEQGGDV